MSGTELGAAARLSGEVLHATYPGFNGGPWKSNRNQAVWNEWAERLNAQLAAASGEPIQEAKK